MYASGIPIGMIVDSKGPRWGVLIGSLCLAAGYFPLWSAYSKGPGESSFVGLCFASFLTGVGSCSSFSGAIKVCATNWPHHRGTATALPLSAFGLSAFAYGSISSLAFPNDAQDLLLLLAIGTFTTVFSGMLLLRTLPPSVGYSKLASDESRPGFSRRDSNQMRRTEQADGKFQSSSSVHDQQGECVSSKFGDRHQHVTIADMESAATSESSSLLSGPGDIPEDGKSIASREHHSHKPDITGWALLRNYNFWKLFIMLSLLCGVGLMTIK